MHGVANVKCPTQFFLISRSSLKHTAQKSQSVDMTNSCF